MAGRWHLNAWGVGDGTGVAITTGVGVGVGAAVGVGALDPQAETATADTMRNAEARDDVEGLIMGEDYRQAAGPSQDLSRYISLVYRY
jgi:hypothetical protein